MGAGVAQVLAIAGLQVTCSDTSADALAKAPATVADGRFGVRRAVERGLLSTEAAEAALGRITFTDDVQALATVYLVVETVPERLDLKIAVFRDLATNPTHAPADAARTPSTTSVAPRRCGHGGPAPIIIEATRGAPPRHPVARLASCRRLNPRLTTRQLDGTSGTTSRVTLVPADVPVVAAAPSDLGRRRYVFRDRFGLPVYCEFRLAGGRSGSVFLQRQGFPADVGQLSRTSMAACPTFPSQRARTT
jgi:hypothetical protein